MQPPRRQRWARRKHVNRFFWRRPPAASSIAHAPTAEGTSCRHRHFLHQPLIQWSGYITKIQEPAALRNLSFLLLNKGDGRFLSVVWIEFPSDHPQIELADDWDPRDHLTCKGQSRDVSGEVYLSAERYTLGGTSAKRA